MLAAAVALSLMPVAYKIPAQPVNYGLDIKLDGFIPLLGGFDGTVELKVGLGVKSLPPEQSNLRASADVTDLKVMLQGQAIDQFNKDSVKQYFPNVVTLTPQGKVLQNNAPNLDVPVQLPGLDIKRFPDVTFLAVEFPTEGVQSGQSWTFSRAFGDSSVQYTVTPTSVESDKIEMNVKMTQDYDGEEDEAHNIVKNPQDAVADVKTHVEGSGTVDFDPTAGLIKTMHMEAHAASTITNLKTKAQSTRNLKTTEDLALAP